jgi:hypothetical protein
MDSTIYSKVLVLFDVLFGNVFGDHLISHIAGTAAEVSPRPQVSSPKLFLQMLELASIPYPACHARSTLVVDTS